MIFDFEKSFIYLIYKTRKNKKNIENSNFVSLPTSVRLYFDVI